MNRPSDILERIRSIPDPEIPVITISDLGILRNVVLTDETAEITITPTYSGCPAMRTIEDEIKRVLHSEGIEDVKIKTVYAPVWTTDWLSAAAKEKLRAYGIAPPEQASTDKNVLVMQHGITCPRCGSLETERISEFGSTACKALYRCKSCLEPFDHFKCH